jgi:arginine decarboxylase
MRFRFPIVIIDEDFRSENTSGLGIRALAKAIEAESVEVIGVTSYGDLASFAQQQSRASAFVLSIDDEEFADTPQSFAGTIDNPATPENEAVAALRKFVREIRRRNADIPIFLYGETRTSRHLPNDVLRELHGFIHMFEDTPEFVARYIIREARAYLETLAPPFFRALTHYAQDGSYSWHCPGHSGGVAFLKSPVGTDVPPVLRRKPAARGRLQRGRGTRSAARPHRTGGGERAQRGTHLRLGSPVLRHQRHQHRQQDRLALHGGAGRRGGGRSQLPQERAARDHHDRRHPGVPDADPQPLRDHRADPAVGVQAGVDPEEDRRAPAAEGAQGQAARAHHHAEHLRRRDLQRRGDQAAPRWRDRLAAFRRSLAAARRLPQLLPQHARHRRRGQRPHPAKHSMVFATQSTHKMLAGLSQASQILVQDSEREHLDRFQFNEAYHMHVSTSPQYAIIASCDVAAAMMEPPGGTALVEESIAEALDFRRAMRKVEAEFGVDSWWFKVWGPQELADEGIGERDDWILRAGDRWHGFGNLESGFNMLDPIKATVITPGLDVDGNFSEHGIPAAIVTKYLAEHGIIVEKTGLYSFFIMFTIGITKGRWNTLVTELQQFKDDHDNNQPLWRVMPDFLRANPQYEKMGLRELCDAIHTEYASTTSRA